MPVFNQAPEAFFQPLRPSMFPPGIALLFDMDGVVIDSMPLHEIAWRKYLQSLGISDESLLARMHGRRNDDIVLDFLGPSADLKSVQEHGAAKERLYRQLMRDQLEQQLVPGIRPFLQAVSALPLGLASNAERPNIDFVLDGAGLRSHFRSIVDGSQVRHPKPAPDVYLKAAQQLGVQPSACIVFEDSPVGVEAAVSAGMRVVGLLTHEPSLQHVELAVPDFLDPRLHHWLHAQASEPQ
jgi:beta-phosphoglucomutase